ncbi:MAG: regulatory protein RecX [Candidatus Dormibacterales bacterium]
MRQRSSRAAAPTRPRVGALDAGLRLLSRRAHSTSELSTKLRRRGHDADEVAGALLRLTELGYLDDRAFAEGHVRRRQAGRGPSALAGELAQRGVGREIAAGAMAGFDSDAQALAAGRLAERLYARRAWGGYREMLNSIGAKLQRRGFSIAVARAACEAAWGAAHQEAEA